MSLSTKELPTAYLGLEPSEVWRHFAALNAIPRPSGSEEAASAYVREVAESEGARWQSDTRGNVCVRVGARGDAPGVEDGVSPIILQSHLDMVCQKRPDVIHNFATDPIVPRRTGDQIFASGTTLGADNGMGAAMMLALLTSKNLRHGSLELLFTVEEETGLFGAAELDPALVTGHRMINLDSEDPEEITVGCAGGAGVIIDLKAEREAITDPILSRKITVSGLAGGHSGVQIHEPLANALKLLAQLLDELRASIPGLRLVAFDGGTAHNAIPRDAWATVIFPAEHGGDFDCQWPQLVAEVEAEWRKHEAGLHLNNEPVLSVEPAPFTAALSDALITLLNALPHGVQKMSERFAGKVQTSSNMAEAHGDVAAGEEIEVAVSNRSFLASDIKAMQELCANLGREAGGRVVERDGYPGWEPRAESPLREKAIPIYESVFGHAPKVEVVHAGLECGLLSEKISDLDAISVGPLIRGAHTPEEWVSISSVAQSWLFLTRLLDEIG